MALVLAALLVYWLEAMFGRWRLRRYLLAQGTVLTVARWQPSIPFRNARFAIEATNDGHPLQGIAVVGGPWTGPVFSRRLEVNWTESR